MRRPRFLPLIVLTLVPGAASAQAPNWQPWGPEFRVNTYTTGAQSRQSAAFNSSSNFIVVWASQGQDGSSYGVFGQRYVWPGSAVGAEFRVNTNTTGGQTEPAVAGNLSPGDFLVVWSSAGEDGSGLGVFGQRYTVAGTPAGPEFVVNTYTTSNQMSPDVAALFSGGFVVVWASDQQDGSGLGVFAQRYAGSGAALGPEFRVNSFTTGDQGRYLSVASGSAGGGFVVVWTSQDGSDDGIFAQRYDAAGVPLGSEFRVNTYTTARQSHPAVDADGVGGFVVVWDSQDQDGFGDGVFAQRYSSSGVPLGPEFPVNEVNSFSQDLPGVAVAPMGVFVVAWQSDLQDGSSLGVFGRRHNTTGTPIGLEFRANTFAVGAQADPTVATSLSAAPPTSEVFIIAWSSDGQDGSATGVYGQLYAPNIPVELMTFRVE